MLRDFKAFLLRGNVVDLAIAFVIGAAFSAVITAFVKDLVTPLIGALVGKPDFSGYHFTVNHSDFRYGDFLNALLAFLVLATVLFFFVVQPVNLLIARTRHEPSPDPTTKKCPHCVSEIPSQATRCAYCTSELAG